MECARNTFSRIFTLLVALGYQVVIKSIDKYHSQLMFASFFYAISSAIALILENMRHNHYMLANVNTILLIPQILMNLVFIIWTAFAFRRTLRYLHRKDDKLKYGIMLKLALIFVAFVFVSCILVMIEIIIRAGDPQLDLMWRSTWFWDKYGLII